MPMTRRDLLTILAALPLCGWMKPKEKPRERLSFGKLSQPTPEMVYDLGGFVVPREFASAIESHQGVFFGERVTFLTPMSKEECCRLRGVPYDQQAEKADAMLAKMITNAMRERS